MAKARWSTWRPFPDPSKGDFLSAPFGPGVYELRRAGTRNLILIGMNKNCAYRMSSLIPSPNGTGTRGNKEKREYVQKRIRKIEYRCIACDSTSSAREIETERLAANTYKYHT